MNIRNIITLAALSVAGQSFAQFDQTFSVEGKYSPEVIRLDRINAFPRQEKFTLETAPLLYDASGVTASFAPGIYPLAATAWRQTRTISDKRGYLDLGAGSWLTSTLSAGYRFIQTERTTLGIRLQHNSTSLWKPSVSPVFTDAHRWRYDECLGIYGSHSFGEVGRLDAALDYHIGNFNYYAFNPIGRELPVTSGEKLGIPTQTLNDISARVRWESVAKEADDVSWFVEAGVKYFGYRRMYLPETDNVPDPVLSSMKQFKSSRETDVSINGAYDFPLNEKSSLGLKMNTDMIFYTGEKREASIASNIPMLFPESYGLINLTPYYRFSANNLNVALGLDIDILPEGTEASYKSGETSNKLYLAPDVRLDYNAGAARLYLNLLGGNRLHTLANGYQTDYYQQPFICNTRPVYTPLDGKFGVSFGPFSGFQAGIGFAYRVSRGEYTGGLYQLLLNNGMEELPSCSHLGLPDSYNNYKTCYSFSSDDTYNLHGYSLSAEVAYDAGKIFGITASGEYQPQNGETGFFNGLDRPRWIADFTLRTNPWNTLKLSLSYHYRGVRNGYLKGSYRNNKGFRETFLTSMRLPDVTSLDFGASYSFTDSFSLWLQADNLLCQRVVTLPGLPTQGITVAGGVSLVF